MPYVSLKYSAGLVQQWRQTLQHPRGETLTWWFSRDVNKYYYIIIYEFLFFLNCKLSISKDSCIIKTRNAEEIVHYCWMLRLNRCFITICFYLAFFSAGRDITSIAIALVVSWLYQNLTCSSCLVWFGYDIMYFNKRRWTINVKN